MMDGRIGAIRDAHGDADGKPRPGWSVPGAAGHASAFVGPFPRRHRQRGQPQIR